METERGAQGSTEEACRQWGAASQAVPTAPPSCGHTILPGPGSKDACRHKGCSGGISPASQVVLPRSLHLSGRWRAEGKSERSSLGAEVEERQDGQAPERRGATPHAEQQLIWACGCF